MALGQYAKLTIQREGVDAKDTEKLIEVMYNPNSYTITKTAAWNSSKDFRANAPTVAFGGGGARELSLELFFDVTELPGEDVRKYSDRIVALAYIDEAKSRPPICTITWGPKLFDGPFSLPFRGLLSLPYDGGLPFTGLLSSVTQKFTLFHASGRPLRATLNVTFTEFLSREKDLRRTDPEETTRTLRRGERLSDVATELGISWRVVALANLESFENDNPRLADAGRVLRVPKVA